MKDYITTTGMIIKTTNLGEYDRRLVVLTSDRGKITIFARGARRQNSKYLAACAPFSFGEFKAFPGRDAYTLLEINVSNYFDSLRNDFGLSCLGMYFLEVADYYSRENNDDLQLLKLLYVSIRILEKIAQNNSSIDKRLVKSIFEIKTIVVNGEFPGVPTDIKLSSDCVSVINHIAEIEIERLYSFTVKEEVLSELESVSVLYCKRFMNHRFKSLELIEVL